MRLNLDTDTDTDTDTEVEVEVEVENFYCARLALQTSKKKLNKLCFWPLINT